MNLPGLDFPGDFPIAPALTLPADADARRLAFVGMSGSGKTSCAKVIVEHLATAGRRVAVVDPNGIWHGLKTSADGTGPGLPFVVFGGRHGDVPLEATAGAAVADLVMDEGLPVILDLSAFEVDADGLRVAGDFISRLRFRQNPDHEPILLVVDEADLIAPQTARKEELASQRALINVAKRSRADGLGLLVITQRPVGLATSILNQMEAVFLLRFAGYNDLDRVKEWLGTYLSPSQRDAALAALPSLSEGECFAVSPAWMKTFQRVQFPLPTTFDSSATPKAGSARRTITARADVDLSALAARFTAAIEAERENDPEELKKRITALEQKLRDRPTGEVTEKLVEVEKIVEKRVEVEKVVEVPVFREGEVERLSAVADDMASLGKDLINISHGMRVRLTSEPELPLKADAQPPIVAQAQQIAAPEGGENTDNALETAPFTRRNVVKAPKSPAPNQKINNDGGTSPGVTRPQQIILNTLADLAALGIKQPQRVHVGLFAGVSPSSSAFTNNLGALRTAGLLAYPVGGYVMLTDRGSALAQGTGRPLTVRDLQRAWLARLTAPQRRIVETLIACYPGAMARDVLAQFAEASSTSSAFTNNLGALRSLGLVNYPEKGQVVATALLFPSGLPE